MIDQIRPADLPRWLQAVCAYGEPLVLDVREPAEWQAASIKANGFALREMSMGQVPPRMQELDPEQPVAVLCHHGVRSMQVAAFLQAHGFARVANIAGGIDAWSVELDPTVPRY